MATFERDKKPFRFLNTIGDKQILIYPISSTIVHGHAKVQDYAIVQVTLNLRMAFNLQHSDTGAAFDSE